jgi:tetratricopeptide (TPR) repeat protein
MKPVLPRIVFLSFAFVVLIAHLAFAETKTFIKEYTYQASEDDSRNSSRVIALREVKRLLLEELGTYLESETEVKNFQITKDQITTLTAGIVQTEIVAEKWDGRIYWLKSKMTANSSEVVQSINELRKDREKTKELESIREKSDDLLKEVKRLRKELASAKDGSRETKKVAYDQSIKELSAAEWIEKGHAVQGRNDNFKGAIDAFSHAIELDQKNIMAYYFRARISEKNSAISDYYRILSIEPKTSEDYLIRAWTYRA